MTENDATKHISLSELNDVALNFSEDEGFEKVLMKYKISAISGFCIGDSMLDIGCGVGALTKTLAPKFKYVVGIDGSDIKIIKAKRYNSAQNISYVCTLFENYAPANSFDFIVSTNVLEHVDNAAEFLQRLKSWLTPKGLLVMTVPNALGLHKRIGKAMGLIHDFYDLTNADIQKGHKHVYDRERLKNVFVNSGYQIKHVGGILLKPLSHKQMESWDPKIVDGLYEVGKELPEYCSSLIIVASL
jgi:2-polyprenyl-3-methyl-5-hydroxy-6-metoxy-1,4-benzoquinol methylase